MPINNDNKRDGYGKQNSDVREDVVVAKTENE